MIICRDTLRYYQETMLLDSLTKATYLINSANQVVIYFDKPEDISLEMIKESLLSHYSSSGSFAGCGDCE